MSVRTTDIRQYAEVASLDRVAFWNPLPLSDSIDEHARRLIRESDVDIRENRLESALDISFAINAIAPDYIPGYIRTSELLIATKRVDLARKMARTVRAFQQFEDGPDVTLPLAKVSAHVDPSPSNSLRVARTVLESGAVELLVPYVPAAIELSAKDGASEEAIELASRWVEASPRDPVALAYLIREHMRNGELDNATATLRTFREGYEADRIWPENVVVSALLAVAAPGDEPNWRTLGPTCTGLRDNSLNYGSVNALLEFLVPVLESPDRALIAAGLFALNASDLTEARALLQTVVPQTETERYLVNAGLSRVAQREGDDQFRLQALQDAFSALGDERARWLANEIEIFDPPASVKSIGIEIAQTLREAESYQDALQVLESLRESIGSDVEVNRMHAEIVGQSGSKREALQQLEKILVEQERERRYAEAVQTLGAMVRLNPGNLSLRTRMVDNLLKLGRFDDATEQLVTQARLLNHAGRTKDAEGPVHRAIEIATMIGDWDKINKLHRLMISFAPNDTRIRHSVVTTYVQHGKTREALEQLREIARIARTQNDLDEAIAASHQLLALAPDDPDSYHQLGELLLAIEEYGQADRVYRRLALLVPDDPSIKAKRSAIAAMARGQQ